MRVCADRNSPYYDVRNFGCQVWCDGKLISRVIEADDEAGWVIRDQDNSTLREILRGRVSIVNPRLLPVPVRNQFTAGEEVFAAFGVTLQPWQREIMVLATDYARDGRTHHFSFTRRTGKVTFLIDGELAREFFLDKPMDVPAIKRTPPNHNERAWQTRRRKGRR